jgi:endo-1,4-beta-xylanase
MTTPPKDPPALRILSRRLARPWSRRAVSALLGGSSATVCWLGSAWASDVARAVPQGPPAAALRIEAESARLGADFKVVSDGRVRAVTATSTSGGLAPLLAQRVLSYRVQFRAPGDYDVYARVKVGPQGGMDDSFFVARSFGKKDVARAEDWAVANGLGGAGYSEPEQLVKRGGRPPAQSWHWINLSHLVSPPNSVAYRVEPGALQQTFQIAAREDGLDIDQLAFAPVGIVHTVAELDAGRAGRYLPPPPLPPPFTPSGPAPALGKEKFLGGVYSRAQLSNFSAYFNQVTPENAGKWGHVEAKRDVMIWDELDASYQFAKQHGFPFKMHVMVWGNQQPSWLEQLPAAEQRREIEQWFAAVAERYPALDYVEIVNEALHDPPNKPGEGGGNYLAALGGDGKTGWDWILESFRLGRRYFPGSSLMINEYGVLARAEDAERYAKIIELLQAEKLVDSIGVQGHAFCTSADSRVLRANLDRLAATGLPVFVTELDVDGHEDADQLAEVQRLFPLFWDHPSVQGITIWGYRPGMWRTPQGAILAHENGAERAAFRWLLDYVRQSNARFQAVIPALPGTQPALALPSERAGGAGAAQ